MPHRSVGRAQGSRNKPIAKLISEFWRKHPDFCALEQLLEIGVALKEQGELAKAVVPFSKLADRLYPSADAMLQFDLDESAKTIQALTEEIERLREKVKNG